MTSYGDECLFTALGRLVRQARYRNSRLINAIDGVCGLLAVVWMAVRHLLPRRKRAT